jgi:hypothetical protein
MIDDGEWRDSGDEQREPVKPRPTNTSYRIRVNPAVVKPPSVEALKMWALDHYALKLLGGYIERGSDPRLN